MALEGITLDNTDTIKVNTKKHLSNIPEDSFQKMFQMMAKPMA
jgi:hypothetical protein